MVLRSRAGFIVSLSSFTSSAQFADAVIAYTPGAWVTSAYTNANSALGEPSRVTPGKFGGPVTPFDSAYLGSQLVSIGTNGSLTLHLSRPVTNDAAHPYGVDFLIFGNAGLVITNGDFSGGGITDGSLYGVVAEGTRVSVSMDGVTFYLLNPALAPPSDAWFPTDGSGNFFTAVNPVLKGADFSGKDLSGIRALYAGSAGGAGFDLAWAQDGEGHSVTVPTANFVRIDVLGEKVEVDGIAVVDAPFVTVTEDFSTNPLAHGWELFGDAGLFRWDQEGQNLEVTWDSAKTNSYLRLPLGTLLTRQDDFSVSVDLTLKDIQAGVNAGKPGAMQIAFGFQKRIDADAPYFYRATGSDSPNLAEFNFFPDTGFGPTVWPAIYSTNGAMKYGGASDFAIFDLPVDLPMHVVLAYTAANETMNLVITTNGVLMGREVPVRLSTNSTSLSKPFTAFELDSFAIASYSDAGQSGDFASSILAHGVMDNLVATFPPPPVADLHGSFTGTAWEGKFLSRAHWFYELQGSTDLVSWTKAGGSYEGTGGQLTVSDGNASGTRFYRIKAFRHL